MYRSAKTIKKYKSRQKHVNGFDKTACPFCKIDNKATEIIHNGKLFNVFVNAFPYDVWDGQRVTVHSMIVPKRHVASVSDFTDDEVREFHALVADYEKNGYSVYYRHEDNIMKSVGHQHTHVIKFDNKKIRFLIFIKKPYILWWK